MGACVACKAAKVKCIGGFPCQRCLRLGRPENDCLPHESRQGRRSSSRSRSTRHSSSSDGSHKRQRVMSSVNNEDEQAADEVVETARTPATSSTSSMCINTKGEAAAIASHMMDDPTVISDKTHFGLQFMVRQWVTLSLKRRSFDLWVKAGALALRCGMSMDDVLCSSGSGQQQQQGMEFLHSFLLTPGEEQKVLGRPLEIHQVPTSLWRSIGITTASDGGDDSLVSDAMEHRWIFIRDVHKGVSRFYASPAFERNVVSREMIEETYKRNQKDVADLYLANRQQGSSSSSSTNSRNSPVRDSIFGFAHQVSLHNKPGVITKPTRLLNVDVLTKNNNSNNNNNNTKIIRRMDQLWCLRILALDHSVGLTEFIACSATAAPSTEDKNNNNIVASAPNSKEEDASLFESLSICMDDILGRKNEDDVNYDDDDFKLIYDFLKNN